MKVDGRTENPKSGAGALGSDRVQIPDLPAVRITPDRGGERILTAIGAALDTSMLRAMQIAVDALLMPTPENLPALRASADVIYEKHLLDDPRRFFEFSVPDPASVEVARCRRRSLRDGTAMGLRFTTRYQASEFETQHGRQLDEGGRELLVEHWVHDRERPRGTVVLLHGFTMGFPRIDAIALFASQWFRRGLDVALTTLPSHGARKPRDARFSGERFAVPHVARMAEAVRQAVFEIRLLVRWLREERPAPVGLLGLSLGGYLAALMAGLYDDLDFVVPMVPPVCFGDLAWNFLARSRNFKDGPPPAFSHPELRAAFRIHSPLAFPCRVPKERLLIVAGRGDRIVPPEHPHALWRHWGEPTIHWYCGSHLAPFRRGRIVAAIADHLRKLDIAA